MSDMISAEEAQEMLDEEAFDAFGAAEQIGALKSEVASMPNRLKPIGDVLIDMTEKVVKDKIETEKTIRTLARTVIALHAQLANAKAAQALVMEQAAAYHDAEIAALEQQIEENNEYLRRRHAEAGAYVAASEANDYCRTHITVHRISAAAIRALADTDGLAMVQELRAERDDLRAAVEGLIAVLDRNDKKGPIPDVEMMFCWLAAQHVRAAFRKIAPKGEAT